MGQRARNELGAHFRRRGAIDPNSPFLRLGKWIDENVVTPFSRRESGTYPGYPADSPEARRLKGEREKEWKKMLK